MTVTLEVPDAQAAALLERTAARFDEVRRATRGAAHGQALAVGEAAALEAAFATGREVLESALAERIAAAEKKGTPERQCCGADTLSKGPRRRRLTTALGPTTIVRRHLHCPRCGVGDCRADAAVGLGDFVSPRLAQALARLGVAASFAGAQKLLSEVFGVTVAVETVRTRVLRTARRARTWQEPAAAQAERFDRRHGDLELAVDGTTVRTQETGWRELKLACWTRRRPGARTSVDAWRTRKLPKAGPRLVQAALAEHEDFSAEWAKQAARLGARPGDPMTYLADGADWIWNDRQRQLPEWTGTLDVYHASEKLHEAGAALLGKQTSAARAWGEAATDELVAEGWPALKARLDTALAGTPTKAASTALHEARTYFWKKRAHLDYAGQLAAGRAVGSGMVEGEAKQMGKRLKANAAAWKTEHVGAMAGLCAILHSGLWQNFHATAN